MNDKVMSLVLSPWPFRWLPESLQDALIALRLRQMTAAMREVTVATDGATRAMQVFAEAFPDEEAMG